MSRFVRPETKVLTLKLQPGQTEPDWLLVKGRLSEGERRAMFARMYLHGANGDGRSIVDPQMVGMSTVLAYLLDWSFVGDDGQRVVIADQPIDVVQSALDALDPVDFNEVQAAIEAHEATVQKARAAARANPLSTTGSATTSPSPSGVTGATNGSPSSTPTSTPS